MKFLKILFKPEFSWFEVLFCVALLALELNFIVFLLAAVVVGMVNAAGQLYIVHKEKSE